MAEREKVCILCGQKEIMLGYICTACQEKIQSEVVDRRREMILKAQRGNIRGEPPDDENK
jgi:hypothetical protein